MVIFLGNEYITQCYFNLFVVLLNVRSEVYFLTEPKTNQTYKNKYFHHLKPT